MDNNRRESVAERTNHVGENLTPLRDIYIVDQTDHVLFYRMQVSISSSIDLKVGY